MTTERDHQPGTLPRLYFLPSKNQTIPRRSAQAPSEVERAEGSSLPGLSLNSIQKKRDTPCSYPAGGWRGGPGGASASRLLEELEIFTAA